MDMTFEGRSRLVSLVYSVLNGLDIQVSGMTDSEILGMMAAECHKVVTMMAKAELAAMKRRGKDALPEMIFNQNDDR